MDSWRQPVPWVGSRCDAAYLEQGHGRMVLVSWPIDDGRGRPKQRTYFGVVPGALAVVPAAAPGAAGVAAAACEDELGFSQQA